MISEVLSEHVPKIYWTVPIALRPDRHERVRGISKRTTGHRAGRPARSHPRRRGRRAVHGVAGPVGRERRTPADRGRPGIQRGGRDLGDLRLRPHLRRAAPARRQGCRPVWPQAGAAARARPVRPRLARRRPRSGTRPACRRPCRAGHRRRRPGPGRAGPADRDVPRGPGPRPGLRSLERDECRRRRPRRPVRWPAHAVRQLALGDVRERADGRVRAGPGLARCPGRPAPGSQRPPGCPRCCPGHSGHDACWCSASSAPTSTRGPRR